MSSIPPGRDFNMPKFPLSDAEFWFDAAELLGYDLYDSVRDHLTSANYQFLTCGMPDLSDDYNNYPDLREFVLKKIEGFGLNDIINSVALFSCRNLKPSAFLHILNKCIGEFVPKSMKRTFWLARLPRRIQKVMFLSVLLDPQPLEDRTLDELAAVADGIAAFDKYYSLPSVKKIKINLPQYVQHDPELWFYSLDEVFSDYGVTDELLKFQHTMNVLRSQDILTAALFLTNLPNQLTVNKYTNLRESIIETQVIIKNDPTYNFVFRNTKGLKPRPLLHFINNLAAKCGRIVPQLLIRTFWIMQLPVREQAFVYQLWTASREPLQDLDIDTMALVVESTANSKEPMRTIRGSFSAPKLDCAGVFQQTFLSELQSATSLQQKIALGMRYCDFMYSTYYKNNPSESVNKCRMIQRDEVDKVHLETEAKCNFFEGCTCWYHELHGEFAMKCTQILQKHELDL